jgi:hypothetical protein
VIPWKQILAGAALVLGGGGAASIPSIIAWATGGDETEATVPAEQPQAEYPLLDSLRERGYHMPPDERPE